MRRVLIAQLGARRHYAVPRALHQAGLLDALVTDACADIPPWRWLGMLGPESWRGDRLKRLMGRSVPEVPTARIIGLPMLDFQIHRRRRSGERLTDHWARRNAAFCRAVVRRGFGPADTVYAFNGAALEIFQAAKQRGLRTILDQTSAPWRWNARLLREEVMRWPGWEDRPSELDESGLLSEREEAEWELADVIVCGSVFCRSTLTDSGVPATKCHVLPHTVPIIPETPHPTQPVNTNGALRVLFAGTLQLRKGVQYLHEAVKNLSGESIELRVVGPSLLSEDANRKLGEYCHMEGAVPRSRMEDHYQWADVLVLPTLSEGSANVCHEAMAAGIPVITTPAAGSAVRHRVNGVIVPTRDAGALTDAIAWMANEPHVCRQFGDAARMDMSKSFEVDAYPDQLGFILKHIDLEPIESQVSISGC